MEPDWLATTRKEGRILSEVGVTSATLGEIVDDVISEERFQGLVIGLARSCGWKVAHFRAVRIARSDGGCYYATPVQADGEGFPDLVLVRDRVIFAELKSAKGKQSAAQRAWQYALVGGGGGYYLWRPRNWDEIEKVLK